MEDTIFSKIIRHELPADVVYEDDAVVAFLDIKPINPGGTLVVPKKWSRNILDIDTETWGRVMEVVRKIAPSIKKAMNASGITIVMNNEPAGNQVVFHSHVHIIPRHENDGGISGTGTPYPEGKQIEIAQKIKEALSELTLN